MNVNQNYDMKAVNDKLAKTKKKLKKGWKYVDDLQELESNIKKGNVRFYIDSGEIEITIDGDDVYIVYDFLESTIENLIEQNAILIDADTYFMEYKMDYQNFCNIFNEIISAKRLSYSKRQ